ncbi:MAG: acyl-CoA N-acyltransferase [Monoraphidium minutum]|nr:MAG: acyl-CoA N-acyltransferase [Monoraphidium minutum]
MAPAGPGLEPPPPPPAPAPAPPPAAPADLAVSVRPAAGLLELRQVARLRAEAYYADDRSRFAESFKRQFVAQEVDSLLQRTAPRAARAPQCDCLVALDASGRVVGCIDVRVPAAATGMPAAGVPAGEAGGAYLLNVVVDEDARGRGVGRALMRSAMARAVGVWGAARLFTHVEAGNDVAAALYRGCGFTDHSGTGGLAGATTLGRLLLLVAEAEGVDTSVASGGEPAAPAPAAA